jgi:hypothetical protein
MFLRPGGYGVETSPDGKVKEQDSFTCKHCNRVVFVNARQHPEDAGGFCSLCSGLICPHCVGKGCDTFEAKLERLERRS